MDQFILALDQGTTSSRALVISPEGMVLAKSQQEFPQILPVPGVVEHDPEAIWQSQLAVAQAAIQDAGLTPHSIAAVGITNQRETTVLWEKRTGRAVAPAIVWQSRVSTPICERLRAEGHESWIRELTGLRLDPYFSASKIAYLFERDASLRSRAERGEVLFGTIDSFLVWRLTGGQLHVTDASNASRTLLFNLQSLDWDDELLRLFGVPRNMLPAIVPSSGVCGETAASVLGASIPIGGIAGDQQASAFGQTCFDVGSLKNTYGTGCFLMLNAGSRVLAAPEGLLTTVGWQIGGKTTYFLEGSVFMGGAIVQWLRDGLRAIESSTEVESLAATDNAGVVFVPAFAGLGAPYWDPHARGAIFGLTRGTHLGHIARAALEAIAFQTRDVVDALRGDAAIQIAQLRVDGGAARNNALMQFQADILGVRLDRSLVPETTAMGAAFLAGLAVGTWRDLDELRQLWKIDRSFLPAMTALERDARYARWQDAVARVRNWESSAEHRSG